MAAFGAATDQLVKFAEADADQIARFHATLIKRGVPAALAKQLTLNFQAHRYGWTGDE
jgi:hypothetical protein